MVLLNQVLNIEHSLSISLGKLWETVLQVSSDGKSVKSNVFHFRRKSKLSNYISFRHSEAIINILMTKCNRKAILDKT